jgi:hypothetical protein
MVMPMRLLDDILNTPRLRADIQRQVRNHQFDRTAAGIYLPKARLHIGGAMTTTVNGRDPQTDHNLLPNAGIDYLLANGLGGNFYFVPFVNNVEPTSGLTAANFEATLDEWTSYSESSRQAWSKAVSGQTYTNTASAATLTSNADSQTLWGAGISTVATKASGTGSILSAVKFSTSRALQDTDTLGLVYELTGADDGV